MANFQFTVRATDSDGAYADRNFAITINNTRVERYMAIDNANAYTSPDLVNWTARNGQGGWDCSYGNSMWLIVTNNFAVSTNRGGFTLGGGAYGANTMVIRKSTDGVNYTTLTYASGIVRFKNVDGTDFVIPTAQMIYGRLSFSNGFFWLPIGWCSDYSQAGAFQHYVARSADGVTWTILPAPFKGQFYFNSTIGHYFRNFAKVQDSGSDILISNYGNGSANGFVSNIYGWRSSDLGATWTVITDSTGRSNNATAYNSPMVTRINGLYIASVTHTQNVPFMVSNDGINWSACNPISTWSFTQPIHSVVYANGTLYGLGQTVSSTNITTPILIQSTDGINWTQVAAPLTGNEGASNIFAPYAGLTYKNGFLSITQNNYTGGAGRALTYVFAGSGDNFSQPVTTNATSGAQVPFGYINGFAAMGS